jgi:ferrous iron transport protein A
VAWRAVFCFSQQDQLKRVAGFSTITASVLRLNLNYSDPTGRLPFMHESLPISALVRGQVAEICQLVGPHELVRRLEELGLRTGARIEIVRGGSPCIIRVDGSTLCFRDDQQIRVLVSPRKSA